MPDKAQLGLEATYRLYETAKGWVFLAVPFDREFATFCKVIGREDLVQDSRFANWAGRYAHRLALGEDLQRVFKTKAAAEWERLLTDADLGCVQADHVGHRRFLHEDVHTRTIRFMVPTASPAFTDRAPGGKYWRHAPVVKFADTPCEEGKPYLGLGSHTRQVLEELGYDDAAIAQLKDANAIGVAPEDVCTEAGT